MPCCPACGTRPHPGETCDREARKIGARIEVEWATQALIEARDEAHLWLIEMASAFD